MKKVALIAKGNSKKTKRYFKNINFSNYLPHVKIELFYTQKPKHAIEIAKEKANQDYDLIIACGGDGTSFEVLNGLLKSSYPKKIFGVLPIGSANDFARAQKLTKQFQQFVNSIILEKIREIDVGKISLIETSEFYYFLNVADAGFGAEVVKKVNAKKHFLPPDLSFLLAITKTLFSYSAKPIKIEFNGNEIEGKTLLVAVANSNCFGGGIYISPEAKINDGLLNLTRIGDVSMMDYIQQIGKLKRAEIVTQKEISYHNLEKISLFSDQKVGVEADGEFLGSLPCEIEIKPKLLRFLDTSSQNQM